MLSPRVMAFSVLAHEFTGEIRIRVLLPTPGCNQFEFGLCAKSTNKNFRNGKVGYLYYVTAKQPNNNCQQASLDDQLPTQSLLAVLGKCV